ncbi:CLUMA_CG008940, isoform A [Clunio marinus]|uniref:CLUMA_CG008940, isoform A n=1 Tax=Clunio marinus TaxID=568069 RepID=A0A1J1I557_9DIPT|nr:CLUMA_CG008940, isoform A [Clunio marinus]
MFGIYFIFLIFFTCFYFLKKHYRQLQLTGQFNGPPGLPIIGNGLELVNKSPIEFIKIIEDYIGKYGKFIRIWLGNQLVFFMTDPKDIEVVLTSMQLLSKSTEYDFLKPWLNTGLLTSTGQKWVKRRKVLTPAFHFKILDDFIEVFDKQSSILTENLRKLQGRGKFNIFPITALCTLDIIGETAMGISFNSQSDNNSSYIKNVNELADIIHRRSYDFISRYDILFKFTPTYRRQQELIKLLHDFTDKVIVARREKLKNKPVSQQTDDTNDIGTKKKMALLDLLLQATVDGKPLTNEDIREEIDTFMFEGHDTTNSAIAFTLYNIGKYKYVQQKCFDEIKRVIGDDRNKPITMKELNELKYLELVIKETLRLYPSVPLIGREVVEEMKINEKIIPKGANLIIGPYFMARDPEIWTNPLEFIPERFDTETTADKLNPYAYIPFSAGSRNCIGQKFAMLELKSTVSKMLRHYFISLPRNYQPEDCLEIVIKSKNGVMIQLDERVY